MYQAVLRDLHLLETIEGDPPPSPGPREVQVRIEAVGVCGSDVHYWAHGGIGQQRVAADHVPGHEATAVILATGAAVEDPRLVPGTAVALEPAIPCGHCDQCQAGRQKALTKRQPKIIPFVL